MTTEEKLQQIDEITARLRHAARHNGAALSRDASLREVAARATECNAARVRAMWQDIATIDRVKRLVQYWTRHPIGFRTTPGGTWCAVDRFSAASVVPIEPPPDLTAAELLEYERDDARLTENMHSWAVVRITAAGTEVLTCGGGCWQPWNRINHFEDENGEVVDTVVYEYVRHTDEEDFLLHQLEAEDAYWSACTWTAQLADAKNYAEGGREWVWLPCTLPADAEKLVSICITRTNTADGTQARELNYSLTEKNCDTSTPGIVGLPHDIWLVGDNAALVSAPQGLLVPKELAEGTETGLKMEQIRIVYNKLETGLDRLRLVGDAFGEEYIVYAIDGQGNTEGAWNE